MNRRIIASALAALTAASALGTASVASAQSRGQDRAAPARVQTQAPRAQAPRVQAPRVQAPRVQAPRVQAPQAQPSRNAQAPQSYGRWQQSSRRYSAGRYTPPRGYQARNWSYGQRLPSQYRTRSYVVSNYSSYGLRAPPSGHQYVRTGNDVVLAAVATGLITAVIAGLFN